MPFARTTLPALNARAQADVRARIAGAAPDLRRGVLGALISADAALLHELYGYIAERANQSTPYTATGDDLLRWASLWGVTPRQASAAAGSVTLSGAPGTPVPADAALQSDAGIEYLVDANSAIGVGGTVTLAVTATSAGAAGNAGAGATLTFISPLADVNAEAVVAAGGLTGGADMESSDSVYASMLDAIQAPPHGGSKADYERWARDVNPALRVWCVPVYRGPGSVRVYIVDPSYAGPETAAAATVTAVADYIDSVKPVGVAIDDPLDPGTTINGLEVIAPTPLPVDFTIDDVPDDLVARTKIEAALRDLFAREAVPEGAISINKIIVAIGANTGVVNFSLTAPATSPAAGAGEILTVGTFAWL